MEAPETKKREKPHWEGKHFSFFTNTACEYFPCHPTAEGEDFNCLFCYCPLYILGRDCGGNFNYLESGVKDCTHCKLPHRRESYGYITKRFQDITAAMAAHTRSQEDPDQQKKPPPHESDMGAPCSGYDGPCAMH